MHQILFLHLRVLKYAQSANDIVSCAQTYPPKDKWTNTGISRFTNMARPIKELHGLRGHLHNKMHTVRSIYEHTSVYNPWKLIEPPSEPITEPKC